MLLEAPNVITPPHSPDLMKHGATDSTQNLMSCGGHYIKNKSAKLGICSVNHHRFCAVIWQIQLLWADCVLQSGGSQYGLCSVLVVLGLTGSSYRS